MALDYYFGNLTPSPSPPPTPFLTSSRHIHFVSPAPFGTTTPPPSSDPAASIPAPVRFNHIRPFLPYHDGWGVGVTRHYCGHDGGVYDSQARDAVHLNRKQCGIVWWVTWLPSARGWLQTQGPWEVPSWHCLKSSKCQDCIDAYIILSAMHPHHTNLHNRHNESQ